MMASFQGNMRLDNESMANKINTICKDLKLLDEFLEQNNLHVITRRPITQAIWCFEELSQHLGIEEVSLDKTLDNTLTDSNNQSIKSLLDESVDMSLASRQQKNIAYNSTEQLFVKIDPSEVYKLSSKELRPNQGVKKPSSHKNIETSGNIFPASTSSQFAPESTKVEPELQYPQEEQQHQNPEKQQRLKNHQEQQQHQSPKKQQRHQKQQQHQNPENQLRHQKHILKSISPATQIENRIDKKQLAEIEILQEAFRNNMQFCLNGNTVKVRAQAPPEETIKKAGSKVYTLKSNPKGLN